MYVSQLTSFHAYFPVPASFRPGDYTAAISNGLRAGYEPLVMFRDAGRPRHRTVRVAAAPPPDPQVFRVAASSTGCAGL